MSSRQSGKCFDYTTPIVIFNKKEKLEKNIPFFKFLFQTKKNKNIFDYLKYGLYSLISIFQK